MQLYIHFFSREDSDQAHFQSRNFPVVERIQAEAGWSSVNVVESSSLDMEDEPDLDSLSPEPELHSA